MTQGGPLPPTVFNVVVNSVVLHWVLLMVKGAEGPDGQEEGEGDKLRRVLLCIQWPDYVHQPQVAAAGVQHPHCVIK